MLTDLQVEIMHWLLVLCCVGLAGCVSADLSKHSADKGIKNPVLESVDAKSKPRFGFIVARQRLPIFEGEAQPNSAHMEDVCTMLKTRPHWRNALSEGYLNWQVEPWYVLAFLYQESRFNPKALSKSLAYGFPQAKDDTWRWYQESRKLPVASRERFDDAVDFIGWYAHKNIARNGVGLKDVKNQYLAYHEGLGGFESSSFLAKPWLITIADKVAHRALEYQKQLLRCPIS